jgi:hypothetical protein
MHSFHGAKKIAVTFFATESGTEPIHDWLRSLSREDQKTIGGDIRTVEFG